MMMFIIQYLLGTRMWMMMFADREFGAKRNRSKIEKKIF